MKAKLINRWLDMWSTSTATDMPKIRAMQRIDIILHCRYGYDVTLAPKTINHV